MTDQIAELVAEDGRKIAVDALKEIARGDGGDVGPIPLVSERIQAAQLLLAYGESTVDSLGNVQRR